MSCANASSSNCSPIGLAEDPLSTQLSRSRRVSRTAGMGHLRPYAASSTIGCRAPTADLAFAPPHERIARPETIVSVG